MPSANPYLNFSGNCLEAFEFYRSVLGGEFSGLSRFSEMPADASSGHAPPPEGIMHVSLPIGDSLLMGSDVPEGMGTVTAGNSCYVCVSPDSPDEGRRVFEGLSGGGEIEVPYEKQFWGDYFGSFNDRFGIRWMVVVADTEGAQTS